MNMQHTENEARAILELTEMSFTKAEGGPGLANLHGYGLVDGKGGRFVICLTGVEYENEGEPVKDVSALTRSRDVAFLWLCGEPFVSKIEALLEAYSKAEALAVNTGDVGPAFEAADAVIDAVKEWVADPEELPAWTVEIGGDEEGSGNKKARSEAGSEGEE